MAYESLQAILEEAGMSHAQLAERPYGAINGTNKIFTVSHKPLTDRNYDDVVDENDVFVLVNGNPASVSGVDAINGVITLETAPPNGAEVLVDYRYSPIPLETVQQRRTEAQDYINSAMKPVDDCAPYDFSYSSQVNPANSTVRAMTRIYAAAMLLIRDYGFNQDSELTSKDGYKKLELVTGTKNEPGMLANFIKTGGVCGNSAYDTIDTVEASSDGDLFGKYDSGRSDYDLDEHSDRAFWRNDNG